MDEVLFRAGVASQTNRRNASLASAFLSTCDPVNVRDQLTCAFKTLPQSLVHSRHLPIQDTSSVI
eukprot:4677773-Lingulodinium_polyedra.AAC.1